ncbi:hypothetical protein L5515_005660 [Caenorhabditis briggsae]|uniref:Ubiquitin carboxyl-terminal hydrolase 36 n=3 Tax=Caenorhabditis briggsae TaxID=6238 RepID=A0AAE9JCL5_CAEBR|nr:hypothetical protein L5515_012935 [Caenorhabditis briggsae]UMM26136.1 hypothetical protein L5515_009965 [Caenorhabditis briggsae]UMM26140.1 hypothetical protein L5515_009969 [Caenorhabditis briggsae]UMM31475.1 hypothetical protein L5515_005660 [Caenorhabditis briggsae]
MPVKTYLPYISITINEKRLVALWDSGAAISYVRHSTAKYLNVCIKHGSSFTAKAANGSTFGFLGEFNAKITIAGVIVNHKLWVADDKLCPANVLLGYDFMSELSALGFYSTLNPAEQKLVIDGRSIPILKPKDSLFQSVNCVMEVFNVDKVCLQPGETTVLRIRNGKQLSIDNAVFLESKIGGQLDFDTTVIHPLNYSDVYLQVLNCSNNVINLDKGQMLGHGKVLNLNEGLREVLVENENNYPEKVSPADASSKKSSIFGKISKTVDNLRGRIGRRQEEEEKMKAGVLQEKRKDSDVSQSSNMEYLLLENGDGTSCFLNVSLNMLFSIKPLRTAILSNPSDKATEMTQMDMVNNIFSGKVKSVAWLRKTMPGFETREGDQVSATDSLLRSLFDDSEKDLWKSIQIVETVEEKCTNCQFHRARDHRRQFLRLTVACKKRFSELWKESRKLKKVACRRCKKLSAVVTTTTTNEINEWMVVLVDRTSDRQSEKFRGFDRDEAMEMLGSSWKLQAYAEHIPATRIQMGHYRSWMRRENSSWACLSDKNVERADKSGADVIITKAPKYDGSKPFAIFLQKLISHLKAKGEQEEEDVVKIFPRLLCGSAPKCYESIPENCRNGTWKLLLESFSNLVHTVDSQLVAQKNLESLKQEKESVYEYYKRCEYLAHWAYPGSSREKIRETILNNVFVKGLKKSIRKHVHQGESSYDTLKSAELGEVLMKISGITSDSEDISTSMSQLDINPEVNHINGDSDSDGSSVQEPRAKSPKIDREMDNSDIIETVSSSTPLTALAAAARKKKNELKLRCQQIRLKRSGDSSVQEEFNGEHRAKSPKIEQDSADSFEIVTPSRPLSALGISTREMKQQKDLTRQQIGRSCRSSQIDSASQSADISFSPSSNVFSSPMELRSTPRRNAFSSASKENSQRSRSDGKSTCSMKSPIENVMDQLKNKIMKFDISRDLWNKRKSNTYEFDPEGIKTRSQLVEFVTVLRNFVVQEIIEVRGQIRNQLTVQLEGPKKSKNEMKRRQICRMGIHIYNDALDKIDKDSYQPITVVYQEAWCLFMERFDITNIDLMEDKKEKEPDHKVRIEEERCVEIELTPQIDETEDGESETDPEYDFEDDGALNAREKRMKKAQKAAKNSPPRLNNTNAVVGEIAELLKNVWEDDVLEEFDEDVDVVGKSLLGQMTLAKRCCPKSCPTIDANEAAAVHEVLLSNLKRMDGNVEDFVLDSLFYTYNGESKSVVRWLDVYERCFQGVRSLKRRYAEIREYIEIAAVCDVALEKKSIGQMSEIKTMELLTDKLRQKFHELYMARKDETHHREEYARKKYESLLTNFENSMQELENEICNVCHARTAAKYISYRSKDSISSKLMPQIMEDDAIQQIAVCRMCLRSKDLPAAALANNFMPEECPSVLSSLNVLESMLIEKARANMHIFYLHSIANKKTPMKATKGVLVVLGTDINSTVSHVANTLPSGSNMTIQVRTGWGKSYAVSMPKVVAALKWLKENNPHYADVEINEKFNFTLGENVFFDDQDASQKDADDLIVRTEEEDDGHLLTQDLVEEHQPIQNVHQQNDNIPTHEKYFMKKHEYVPISVETKMLDEIIFPRLHPRGNTGLDALRQTLTKFAKYVRTRLRHMDRRWATDANWLCYMYGRKMQLHLTSVQGISARVEYGTKVKDFDLSDDKVQKSMTSAYAKIRGFPQYWKKVKFEYVPADATDIVNYITSYTTKGEKAKKQGKDNMERYAMEGMSKSKALFQIGLDICNKREVGLLELVDDLMGHENYAFDMAHVFIYTDSKSDRPRMLRPKNRVQNEESIVHELSWLDDYYPNRGEEFANFSLYNIMANFEVVTEMVGSRTRRNRPIDEDQKKGRKSGGQPNANYDFDSDGDNNGTEDEFDRVTSLEGLHLAGLHTNKIMFDEDAFKEANRLRATLNPPLPPLECGVNPKKNMPDFSNDSKKAISKKTKERKQRILYDLRKTATDVEKIIPRLSQKTEFSDQTLFESVFIGFIHVMAMMEHVHKAVLDFDQSKLEPTKLPLAFNIFRQCFNNEMDDVWEIAHRFDRSPHMHVIHDVINYFVHNILPWSIIDMFSRKFQQINYCVLCKDRQRTSQSRSILFIENGRLGCKLNEHITECLRQPVAGGECGVEIGNEPCGGQIQSTGSLGSKSRYLVVGQLDGFASSYAPLPKDPFLIGDSRFLLVGAVSLGNLGSGSERDRVKAWYRQPDSEYVCYENGGQLEYTRDVELKGMHFFVFVEKPKERLTELEKKRVLESDRIVPNFDYVKIASDVEMDDVMSDEMDVDEDDDDEMPDELVDISKELVASGSSKPTNSDEEPPFLFLPNSGSDCFLNCVMNMFYRCIDIRRSIQSSNSSGRYVDMMKDIFNKNNTRKRVTTLRMALPRRFSTGHQDAGEAAVEIADTLEKEKIDLSGIRRTSSVLEKCTVCSYEEEGPEINMLYTNIFVPTNESFQKSFDDYMNPERRCGKCDRGLVRQSERWMNPKGNYHIVLVGRDQSQRFRGNNEVTMFGARWKPVAFVGYTAFKEAAGKNGTETGHYVSWMKNGSAWTCINDDREGKKVSETNMFLSDYGVNIIVFERIRQPTQNSLPPSQTVLRTDIPRRGPKLTRESVPPTGCSEERLKPPARIGAKQQDKTKHLKSYVLLKNSGSDCFLNVVINFLCSATQFKDRIISQRATLGETGQQLAELFSGEVNSVDQLRFSLGNQFHTGWQDVTEVFEIIVDMLVDQEELLPELSAIVERTPMCMKKCSSVTQVNTEYWTTGMLSTQDHSFERMIQGTLSMRDGCHQCGGPNLSTRSVISTADFHIVRVEKLRGAKFSESLKAKDEVKMFGDTWSVVCFVEFVPPGHYVCWTKTGKEWLCISDDKIKKKVNATNMDLKDFEIRMIMFQKVSPADVSSKNSSIFGKISKTVDNLRGRIGRRQEEGKLKADVRQEKRKDSDGSQSSNMEYLLLENGDGTSCFLNVSLNMLFSIKPLRTAILNNPSDRATEMTQMDMVKSIFSGKVKSAAGLRKTMPGFQTREGDQVSATDSLLQGLFDDSEKDLWKSIQIMETVEEKCTNCKFDRARDHRRQFLRLTVASKKKFSELWKESRKPKKVACRRCKKLNAVVTTTTTNEINEWMVVLVDRTSDRQSEKFRGFDRDEAMEMLGSSWKLQAFKLVMSSVMRFQVCSNPEEQKCECGEISIDDVVISGAAGSVSGSVQRHPEYIQKQISGLRVEANRVPMLTAQLVQAKQKAAELEKLLSDANSALTEVQEEKQALQDSYDELEFDRPYPAAPVPLLPLAPVKEEVEEEPTTTTATTAAVCGYLETKKKMSPTSGSWMDGSIDDLKRFSTSGSWMDGRIDVLKSILYPLSVTFPPISYFVVNKLLLLHCLFIFQ